ncbi:phage holin family protein [Scytonema sp. NUACC26]|uniref:phage holin family protein n=1 Tax=Scytonema sp. NUACC26 TaxID=3140176 RepID=UPI0034DBF6C3
MNIGALLLVWLVTAIGLFVVSKLPFGVEIDSPEKAFLSAAVLGIITAVVRPILRLVFAVPNFLTFNLLSSFFTFIISVVSFGIAAWLVQGFRLRYGAGSAILGALTLSILSSLIYHLLGF